MSVNDPRPDDTRPYGSPLGTAAPSRAEPDYTASTYASPPYARAEAPGRREIGERPRRGTRHDPAVGSPRRQAHLQLSRVDPLSVMKFSFVMAIVGFIVWFVAAALLYGMLSVLGVFDAVSSTVDSLTSSGGGDAANWFSAGRILGYAVLIGAFNVVIMTLLATLGAYLYNVAADLVGGVKVTLSESE